MKKQTIKRRGTNDYCDANSVIRAAPVKRAALWPLNGGEPA
jgi:hypothetical protein